MKIVFLPLALAFSGEPDPAEGALTRAIPREIAVRVGGAPDVEVLFRPFLHSVEGRHRFGVYDQRWPTDDLERLLGPETDCDLVVHGDGDFGDPFRLVVEVLRVPGLTRVAEETFEGPRFDGFSTVAAAAKFVLRCAGIDAAVPGIDDFPAKRFRAWLHLLRGRDAASRLDAAHPPEDPEAPFEPYLDALDEEPGFAAARDELSAFATTAAASGVLPLEACEKAIRRLLETARKSAAGHAALGRIREMAEDPAGAEEELRRAVDLEPGRASLRYELGALLVRQGRLGRAAKILETVKSDETLGPSALLDLGTIRVAKDDPDAAIEYWREAVARDPSLGDAWANLSKLLVSLGRFDEAEEAFDRGFELPEPPGALRQAAGVYLAEQNRYKDALPHLLGALKHDGTDPVVRLQLGRCYEAEGEKAKALHHLRKALHADGPISEKARSALGEFEDVGREEKILEQFDDAIQRPPEEQIVLLKGLLKEEAKFPDAMVRLGLALLASKKPRSAEKWFRKAIKMVDEDPEAWSGLATALKNRRKLSAAEEAHRKAIERAPGQAGYHLNLADTLIRLDRRREAAQEIATARALDPQHPLLPGFLAAATEPPTS